MGDIEAELMTTSRRQSRQVSIFINKLEAARRQLDAAIRMTFANEDSLAIHTIAAAAYRITRDILHKRGRHDPDELLRAGIYALALSIAHGKISDKDVEYMKETDPAYALIFEIADGIKAQEARGREFTLDQISISSNDQVKKAHWQSMSKVSTFLKHADLDTDASLNLDEVDNDKLIFQATGAYVLASHNITPEIAIFFLYWIQRNGPRWGLRAHEAKFVNTLERLSPARRRRACAQLIRISKRHGGVLPFWNT